MPLASFTMATSSAAASAEISTRLAVSIREKNRTRSEVTKRVPLAGSIV